MSQQEIQDRLRRWKGKTALVTGASSGIGKATAMALAPLEMRIALVARRQERLDRLADEISDLGSEVLVLPGDLCDLDFCRSIFEQTETRWGPVEALINNAGVSGGKGILQADWPTMETCLDLNVKSALFCLREAVRRMQAADLDDGAVVTISSLQAHRTTPGGGTVYSASKHALRVLVNGVRFELARQRSPIKIAMISPGMIDTEWHEDEAGETHYDFPPLQPEDIAQAALHILSTPPNVQVSDLLLRPTGQSI